MTVDQWKLIIAAYDAALASRRQLRGKEWTAFRPKFRVATMAREQACWEMVHSGMTHAEIGKVIGRTTSRASQILRRRELRLRGKRP